MSQPQTLTVDQQEILARANEVEAPMAEPPTNVPAAPCTLTAAQNAAEQLDLSAENMRTFLAAGHRERQRLATSLRNAAKAYGEVDDESATALNSDGNGTVEAESAGGAGGDSSAELQDTPQVAAAGDPGFTDLKTAATKIGSGDQGVSLADFADAWTKLNFALQRDVKRFRPFDNWQGDAATACEASLDQQREWIVYMAQLAAALAKQANYIAQLQYWARTNHPTLADIESLEQDMKDPNKKSAAMKVYAEYQSKSEQVLKEYNDKANLEAINPKKPPAAIKIDPPPPAQPQGLIPGFLMPPSDGSGGGMTPMTPMAPMAPTAGAGGGMPAGAAAELTAPGARRRRACRATCRSKRHRSAAVVVAGCHRCRWHRLPVSMANPCDQLQRVISAAQPQAGQPPAAAWPVVAWECRWALTARARVAPNPRAPSKTTRRFTPRTGRGPRPSSVTAAVKTARSRSDQL